MDYMFQLASMGGGGGVSRRRFGGPGHSHGSFHHSKVRSRSLKNQSVLSPCHISPLRLQRRDASFSRGPHHPSSYHMAKLEEMNLCMQVMDFDRFSRDDPIGEILLPLKGVKLDSSPVVYMKNLQKPTAKCMDGYSPEDEKGEIMLSLCYSPQKSKLSVAVIRAKNLPAKDITGTSDPYVKVWLIEQGSKVEKRKTSVKSHTLQPSFNESFTFNVTSDKVDDDIQMAITVMDYDMLSSNDEMGHIILGRKGSESGQKHWKEMISKPEAPVIMWHRLSPKW